MSKNGGKFFLAGLLGALAGAVGGMLLAPKSGKETRRDLAKIAADISKQIQTEADVTRSRVKDIYGKVNDEAMTRYKTIRSTVISKVAAVKTAGEEIDKEKYTKIVDGVVDDFKSDLAVTKNGATKIATYLKKDWEKVKKALV